MTIERSHGKARPTLPRASDLRTVPDPAQKPTAGRDAQGRFAPGNRAGLGARYVATIKRALGPEGAPVVSDARRIYAHTMRRMPSQAAPVAALVSMYARHAALFAHFSASASELGLDTPQGAAQLAIADKQSQRAERLLVTALDVATKLAETERRTVTVAPWLAKGGA